MPINKAPIKTYPTICHGSDKLNGSRGVRKL